MSRRSEPNLHWAPPGGQQAGDKPILARDERLEQHRANWRRWLRQPCARTYLDAESGQRRSLNRHPRATADVRFYEAAVLGFNVSDATPEALSAMLWFFALSDELRLHLVHTLPRDA